MLRFPFFVLFCSTVCTDLSGVPSWETDTVTLGTSSGANTNVNVSQGPNTSEVVAVWADSSTYAPYYSIFQGGTWTAGSIPLTVSSGINSLGVYNNIFVAQGPAIGQLMATWSDYNLEEPYYSFYNGTTWTTGAISPGSSNGTYIDLCI